MEENRKEGEGERREGLKAGVPSTARLSQTPHTPKRKEKKKKKPKPVNQPGHKGQSDHCPQKQQEAWHEHLLYTFIPKDF